jgi:hypothetical protein
MKKAFKLFVTLFLFAVAVNTGMAQMPSFSATVKNITTAPDGQGRDSILRFDIYVMHTNAGSSDPFNYAAGQYWLDRNPAMSAGGLKKIGSDLPAGNQSPTFTIALNRFGASPNIPVNNNVIVPSTAPGIRVLQLEAWCTLPMWPTVPPNMVWRTGPTNPFTKIAYFLPDGQTVVEIPASPSNTFGVDSNDPLPVELASFVAAVNRNNVKLDWTTSSETNNAGFDIERKAVGTEEWTKVGNVSGNGTTTETKTYSFSDRPTNAGSYNYRLKQIDFNGNHAYHALSNEVVVGVPSTYAMSQNYPNPFNPTTKIDFDLPYDGKVRISLFDISGREVGTLVNDVKPAGYYTVQFNASNFASGMYFYRISAEGQGNNFTSTKKMVLIK